MLSEASCVVDRCCGAKIAFDGEQCPTSKTAAIALVLPLASATLSQSGCKVSEHILLGHVEGRPGS